jgi:hypothetical protein
LKPHQRLHRRLHPYLFYSVMEKVCNLFIS